MQHSPRPTTSEFSLELLGLVYLREVQSIYTIVDPLQSSFVGGRIFDIQATTVDILN